MKEEILRKRYFLPEEDYIEQMFERVAVAVASAEENPQEWERKFFRVMNNLEFLPNSPTLANAGTNRGTLSACFVLPLEDSLQSIYDTLTTHAMIHRAYGGVGINFSQLRPEGDIIHSTGGRASGPCWFLKVFDASSNAVRQGGKRGGANMGLLNCDHPDVLKWIRLKESEDVISQFNLSVGITEAFMRALVNRAKWELKNPRDSSVWKEIDTLEIWEAIARGAWLNGEPGVVFLDKFEEFNPTPKLGRLECVNPCSEQPLLPYESCNLGSINLANFVEDGKFNFERLREVVEIAVRFLDDVIDVNWFPLNAIAKATKRTRKIGLGVMGWHDVLLILNIPYNSSEALRMAEDLMSRITNWAVEVSRSIAEEKGSFPVCADSIWQEPMRNATLTTIAPTGTLSIIAECSPSIEPVFNWSYKRRTYDGEYDVVHPLLRKLFGYGWQEAILKNNRVFKTALEISPEWHVKHQAMFQKFTHNAVSKTINMPNSSSIGDVEQAILLAYNLGCKGITVYREGSRRVEVMSVKKARPEVLQGYTIRRKTGCGRMYVTINMFNDKPWEVFIDTDEGGCQAGNEAMGRLVSLALRQDVPVEEVIKQLCKVRCLTAVRKEADGRSCADIIGKTISQYVKKKINTEPTCPDCGAEISFEEGCRSGSCKICGWSGCV